MAAKKTPAPADLYDVGDWWVLHQGCEVKIRKKSRRSEKEGPLVKQYMHEHAAKCAYGRVRHEPEFRERLWETLVIQDMRKNNLF